MRYQLLEEIECPSELIEVDDDPPYSQCVFSLQIYRIHFLFSYIMVFNCTVEFRSTYRVDFFIPFL